MQRVCPCEEHSLCSWLLPFSNEWVSNLLQELVPHVQQGQQKGVGVESVTTAGWQQLTGLSSSLREKCMNYEKQPEL